MADNAVKEIHACPRLEDVDDLVAFITEQVDEDDQVYIYASGQSRAVATQVATQIRLSKKLGFAGSDTSIRGLGCAGKPKGSHVNGILAWFRGRRTRKSMVYVFIYNNPALMKAVLREYDPVPDDLEDICHGAMIATTTHITR